jgi:putative Holliday junction resolvase
MPNDRGLLERLAALCKERNIGTIVVGMPYSADGGKGAKAREVDAFIARLAAVVRVPVDTWDESLTSVEAQAVMRQGGMRKKQRREKGRVDEMAARLLLQEYLDHRNNGRITGA